MSRLSKNIAHNLIGQSLLLLLGLVAVRYVFRLMGEDALGIILFTLLLSNVLTAALELGINSSTVREVSSHLEAEPDYIIRLIQTASAFYWSAYLVLIVGVWAVAPWIVSRWVQVGSIDSATAVSVVRILGAGALTAIPRSLYMSLFRGLQRMEIINLIEVSTNILQQAGIVAILVIGGSLGTVAWWMAASYVVGVAAYLLFAMRWFPVQAFVPRLSADVVARNLTYALRMMSISVLAMVQLQADKLMVSRLLPLGFFGYYAFAYSTVSRGGSLVTGAVVQAAFPALSERFRADGRDAMMPQYRKLQDLVLFGTVPLFAVIPFAALPVFGIIFNPEIARMLLLPTTFLAVGYFMNGAMNVPYVFSLAVGRPEISAKANALALVVVLPASWLLIRHFGLNGAGFSWILYHLFAYSYTVPRICTECLQIPTREWFKRFLGVLAVAFATYGTAWLVVSSGGTPDIVSLISAFSAATIAFGLVAWLMMTADLRTSIAGAMRLGA